MISHLARITMLLAITAAVFGTSYALGAASNASRPAPRTTVPDVEDEVMCPTCDTTLDQSTSPAAERMRLLVRRLVADGLTKDEVKQELVDEYGGDEAVLATPRPRGIGLLAWLVPGLVAAIALITGVTLSIRWRRRRTELDARATTTAATAPGQGAVR